MEPSKQHGSPCLPVVKQFAKQCVQNETFRWPLGPLPQPTKDALCTLPFALILGLQLLVPGSPEAHTPEQIFELFLGHTLFLLSDLASPHFCCVSSTNGAIKFQA